MQRLEHELIGSGQVSGEVLMERAGRGVTMALLARWGDRPAGRAVVLCGPGNNGGDGYVVARQLTEKGWQVAVFALGDPATLPPDARTNYDRWAAHGSVADLAAATEALLRADVVVDALFGIGLARPLSDPIGDVLEAVPETAMKVAVDVPSGWGADEGKPLGPNAFSADLTVTFHARKPIHEVLSAAGQAVALVDIGLCER